MLSSFSETFWRRVDNSQEFDDELLCEKNTVEVVEKFVGLNKIWVQLKER